MARTTTRLAPVLGAALLAGAWTGAAAARDAPAPAPVGVHGLHIALARPAPFLRSQTALVVDQHSRGAVLQKNTDRVGPIASITKLMTAMVLLDAHLPMDTPIRITPADVDHLKGSRSRLAVGATLTRGRLLKLALMASENRAAAALARTYPGGKQAFVAAMNRKAARLGMDHSHFADPTGLNPDNIAAARDLARLVEAASHYGPIRDATTTHSMKVSFRIGHRRRHLTYVNTDPLVRHADWRIGLSKTGYISEAGRCLVIKANVAGRRTIIVLLNSWGRLSGFGDANRIRHWLEKDRHLASE